jgi:hypothetical protein
MQTSKAPFECYLQVEDCKSGEFFFKELKDDDLLSLEDQLSIWIEEDSCGELVIDFPLMEIQGDFYAQIKTDWREPESPICWESAGLFIKSL